MRSMRHVLSIFILLSTSLVACDTPSSIVVVEEPDSVTGQGSKLFDETTACTTEMLGGACKGPWAYRQYVNPCYNERQDRSCGFEPYSCLKYPACLHAQWGGRASKEETAEVGCRTRTPKGCGSLSAACTNVARNWKWTVKGNLVNVISTGTLHGPIRRSPIDSEGSYEKWQPCTAALQNAENSESDLCGPARMTTCRRAMTCRRPEFGEAPKGQCGTETTWRSSNSGKTFAELAWEDAFLDPATEECSTLEDRAVDAARFTETIRRSIPSHDFWNTLPASPEQEEAARRSLLQNAKLMFELGITSPDIAPSELRPHYDQFLDEAACGVSGRPSVSESCLAWGASRNINGAMGLCQRLLSSHMKAVVEPGAAPVFDSELYGCFALLGRPALRETDACAGEYRGNIELLTERLFAKQLEKIRLQEGPSPIAGLTPVLQSIDKWYDGAAQALAGDPNGLADATSRVLSGFWQRIHQVGAALPNNFPAGEAGSQAAGTALAELFSTRLHVDRQVLAAAFASPSPLDSPPLLLVTADALTSLYQRLRSAAPLYDFACRYGGDCSVDAANEATKLIRLIAALGAEDQEISTALTAASTVRPEWLSVFTAIYNQRATLLAAYRNAAGRPEAELRELYAAGVVPSAAGLAEILSASRAMWMSYEGSGLLSAIDGRVIRTGLNDSKRVSTKDLFDTRRANLNQQRESYQRARGDFANGVLQQLANGNLQTRVNAEIALLEEDLRNVSHDLEGLLASQDQAENLLGSFLATYNERAASEGWLPDYPVGGDLALPRIIDATVARGTDDFVTPEEVPDVAMIDPLDPANGLWSLTVGKGDMLSFDVRVVWAPTCALRDTRIVGPSGSTGFADPIHSLAGPEGYTVSFENNQFRAHEYSSSDFSSQTDQTSVCGSINASAGGYVSASASHCRQWQTGHSETDTSSSGGRFSYGASFAGGLRIPGTPFPTLPGASLLLVEIVGPETAPKIRNVQVVRRDSTFLFPEAARVYLVANDRDGCTSIDESTLQINYRHSISTAEASRRLAETMADVLTWLREQEATYVAQGSVTATELGALETAAYDRLRTACNGCELSAYPEEVRGMFDAWLSAELASLERKTRIAAQERELDRIVLRLSALDQDLAGAANSARLLRLMTTWQFGQLGFHELRANAALLLEFGNDYVLPMLRIRYPEALSGLRTSSSSTIEALRTADWMLPFDELALRLENLAARVSDSLALATLLGVNPSAPVMIAFPKPNAEIDDLFNVTGIDFAVAAPERLGDVWERCQREVERTVVTENADGTSTVSTVVELADDYCLKPQAVFTVSPEDAYLVHEVGSILCSQAAPVIRSMAVYAINRGDSLNENWNAVPHRRSIVPSADVLFPTESGLIGYRVENLQLAGFGVSVLAGRDSEVWETFTHHAQSNRDGEGLSPFGNFGVDFGSYATDLDGPVGNAHSMILVLDLEARGRTGPLLGLNACGGTP